MSVVNNIQGTLTQNQQPQQVQQQQGDHARVQQEAGEVRNKQEQEVKQNTISQQEDVDLAKLGKDEKEKKKEKNKGKKKTLESDEDAKMDPKNSLMFGGGLFDMKA